MVARCAASTVALTRLNRLIRLSWVGSAPLVVGADTDKGAELAHLRIAEASPGPVLRPGGLPAQRRRGQRRLSDRTMVAVTRVFQEERSRK